MRKQQTIADVIATRRPCGGGCGGLLDVGAVPGTNCAACVLHAREEAQKLVVTDAMRLAVKAEQCSLRGHSFDTVVEGLGNPVLVICTQCERSWAVQSWGR